MFSVSTIEDDLRREVRIARKVGMKEGLEEGRQEGIAQGEARYGALVERLMDAGRLDDLRRAAADASFREALFAELGL